MKKGKRSGRGERDLLSKGGGGGKSDLGREKSPKTFLHIGERKGPGRKEEAPVPCPRGFFFTEKKRAHRRLQTFRGKKKGKKKTRKKKRGGGPPLLVLLLSERE